MDDSFFHAIAPNVQIADTGVENVVRKVAEVKSDSTSAKRFAQLCHVH